MKNAIASTVILFLTASAAQAERPVRSLLEMRQEGVVMQRWDNSCGAAALATLLTFDKGVPISEETVARGLLQQTSSERVRQRGGFSLLDMKRYLAQIGFNGEGYADMTLEDLGSRVPMIVPIQTRGYDHFIVVRKLTDDFVAIADPGFGAYRMSRARFSILWSGIGFELRQTKGSL